MIKEIAEYLDLNIWDWIAVIIAFSSLVVASFSFYIARKTLQSQVQTEKNTMPIITTKIQEFLFGDLVLKLLDAHVKLTALWHLLNDKDYAQYPSEHILEKLIVDKSIIHTELFYKEDDKYREFEGYIELIESYNINIKVLNNHLKNERIDKIVLYSEFLSVIRANTRMIVLWSKIMTLIFDYSNEQKTDLLKPFIDSNSSSNEEEMNLQYFKSNEEILEFVKDDNLKRNILLFLDQQTIDHIKEFSSYLIKKN